MADEYIIDLFFARSEEAISALDARYGKLCHKVAANILGNHQDAEECVNDSYLGVWNTIPPQRPRILGAFVCRIVRNQALKRYDANTAAKRNSAYDVAMEELEGCLASPDTVEAGLEAQELKDAIEGFLDTLSQENRVIFMRRYYFSDPYADISARVGISEKNVSVRLTRIRSQLREYLLERGFAV